MGGSSSNVAPSASSPSHHKPYQIPPAQHHHHKDVYLTSALPSDAGPITDLITAAYTKYLPRMPSPTPPAPMLTDYAALIASQTQDIHVLRARPYYHRNTNAGGDADTGADNDDQTILLGSVMLADSPADDSVLVHNLVVAPQAQGRGYGRLLLDVAERAARERARPALTLFTNEVMWENLAVYARMGFVEVGRRVEDGYRRVYFRKELGSPQAVSAPPE